MTTAEMVSTMLFCTFSLEEKVRKRTCEIVTRESIATPLSREFREHRCRTGRNSTPSIDSSPARRRRFRGQSEMIHHTNPQTFLPHARQSMPIVDQCGTFAIGIRNRRSLNRIVRDSLEQPRDRVKQQTETPLLNSRMNVVYFAASRRHRDPGRTLEEPHLLS